MLRLPPMPWVKHGRRNTGHGCERLQPIDVLPTRTRPVEPTGARIKPMARIANLNLDRAGSVGFLYRRERLEGSGHAVSSIIPPNPSPMWRSGLTARACILPRCTAGMLWLMPSTTARSRQWKAVEIFYARRVDAKPAKPLQQLGF